MSPEQIEELFARRDRQPYPAQYQQEDALEEKLVPAGMQCPYIGISRVEPDMVCCLVYHDSHEDERFASFFRGTCRTFLCTAWRELEEEHVLFAAKLMADWYYYSLMIQSPEMLMDLCAEYHDPGDVPDDLLEELKTELVEKLREDDLI